MENTSDEINLPYDRIAQVYNGQAGSKYSQFRARVRIDWLVSQTQGEYVLDIGCSEGIVPILLAQKGINVVAIDINPRSIEFAEKLISTECEEVQKRVDFINIDALKFDNQKQLFDTVILGEILEHLEYPEQLIQKSVSMLKPSGIILITTPFGYFPDPDHRQTFTILTFLSLIEKYISVESIEVVDGYIQCNGKKRQSFHKNGNINTITNILELTEKGLINEQKRYHQMLIDQTDENRKLAQEKKQQLFKISNLENKLHKYECNNIKINGDLNKTKSSLLDLNKQYQSLSQTNIEIQTQISVLNQAIADYQTQISVLNQATADYQTQISVLNQAIVDYQTQIKNLKNDLVNKENELTALNQKYLSFMQDSKKNLEQITYYIEQFQKYRGAYIDMENSIAYRVGNVLKLAVKQPGKNTLLLPFELVKLFFEGLARVKKRKSMLQAGKIDNRLLQQDFQLNTPYLGTKNIHKKQKYSAAFTLPSEIKTLHDLKIASIMDQFTFNSFDPECQIMQITPENWKEQLDQFKPHLFFLESAWEGKDRLWYRQIDKVSSVLQQVISWCNKNKIPVVFWNKEDPIHFNTFIHVAALCDFIFTTDIELISQYKAICGHKQVFLLPFAAQPKIHNPIEKYDRKNSFCFAGAYYAHFSERVNDFEMIFNTLSSLGDFDIFDRNSYPDNPNYQFPEKYQKSIQGTLKPNEIDWAYKGYRYGINLNTIKQSQTMFARRVYELLASNTVTISNYSRGMRNLLGDLVLSSDNGNYLLKQIQNINQDEVTFRKFRLAGLRKVMEKNTYQDRLDYIVKKVFNKNLLNSSQMIYCISFINNISELKNVIKSFEKQSYSNKRLILVSKLLPDIEIQKELHDKYIYLYEKDHISENINNYIKNGYIAILDPRDYYGINYLIDMSLALRYTQSKVIGKSAFYNFDYDTVHLQGDGNQYKFGTQIPIRCGMISFDQFDGKCIGDLLNILDDNYFENKLVAFSIDEFNYCQNYIGETLPVVDDLPIKDKGKDIRELQEQAENIKPFDTSQTYIYPNELHNIFSDEIKQTHEINYIEGALDVISKLEKECHQYIYSKVYLEIDSLNISNDSLCLFSAAGTLDLCLVLFWFSENKEKLGSIIINRYKSTQLTIPKDAKFFQLGLRLQGKGHSSIKSIKFSKKEAEKTKTWIGKSDILLLTNAYPSYDDLYRNAFIHRRVFGYREEGKIVDILRFSTSLSQKYYEFQGIDVSTGCDELLEALLISGQYKKILVHFLDQRMWSVLKKYLNKIKLITWIHGSDIQPWWRREYNYRSTEEKNQAVYESMLRQNLWNDVFAHDQTNLHYVFVSKYMANEVVEDYKIDLNKLNYSIIHNFIDTSLFTYQQKEADQRKKILTIRPFASLKYANDLTVKAILELANKPFFKDLEFKIIGRGELFEETTAPLRNYSNISLEQKFINQEEITELHKDFGIFLCPTRMDAQGVSRDEAMASGLVPITNNVAAIPEFVDESCGILAPAEDYLELANGIEMLYNNPELFLKMSQNAANRVRMQSSYCYTITKELNLINGGEE